MDYGGNEGKTFTDRIGTRGKFVFDISGVKTIDGVNGISDFEELKQHSFDFIMCNMVFEHVSYPLEILKNLKEIGDEDTLYYIEVPDENPFIKGNKFSIWKNWPLIFNRNLSIVHLIKSYFKQLKDPFMPMKEHINFFTEKSLTVMIESNGFQLLDLQRNDEKGVIGWGAVLSALFKKKV